MVRSLLLLIGGLLMTPMAQAVAALSTEELMSHCENFYDERARQEHVICVCYIQGFIDGTVTTDERVTRNIVQEYDKATGVRI